MGNSENNQSGSILALLEALAGGGTQTKSNFKDEITPALLIKDATGINVDEGHKELITFFKTFEPSESYEGDIRHTKKLFDYIKLMNQDYVAAMLLDFVLDD